VFFWSGRVIEETDLNRIANVIMQSGQSVPDWMVKLPKPGKKKKKDMGKAQRAKASVGLKGENVGRAQALKKKYVITFVFPLLKAVVEPPCTLCDREMVAASKRRKDAAQENDGFGNDGSNSE
jgi:hypothetical protein